MILRKNISLNEEYLRKLEPLMKKHNENLSAVIREVIDLADAAFHDPDSVKRFIAGLKKEQNLTSSALIWAMKNFAGRLPDEETVHNILGNSISSVSNLEKRLNEAGGEIYWGASFKISSDNDTQPQNATVTINGKNPDMNRFLAAVIAVFAAKKYTLGISGVRSTNGSFEMEMKHGENEWSLKSIAENFGYMDNVFYELYKKPDLWTKIVYLYVKMNYDMVVMSRKLFEEILGGNANPKISPHFENFFGCPVSSVPHEDFLKKIKVLYRSTGLIDDMDINKDSIIIHHGLGNPDAIKKLAGMFVELLKLNGHTYSSAISENLIVLKQLPAIGGILIRMVEDFDSGEPLTSYHADLLRMLDLLKNVPSNEEFIKSLGGKFGKRMIQNYEKDIKIEKWDPVAFARYVQEMGIILAQDSKWTNVGNNVIHGKIITCPLVKADNKFDTANCTFIKGIFEEWISHAFGERTQLVHTLSYGKDCCEIYVAF